MKELIDLKEPYFKEMLPVLLQDKTTGENIIFATDIYSKNNIGFYPKEQIDSKSRSVKNCMQMKYMEESK